MMQVQRVKLAGRALAPALLSLVLYGSAEAAELKVFGSRVTKVILGELGPQFEKATGFKPVVTADVAQVISTVEAFRQTLLNAKSITYLKEGASTIHLRKLFDQLGITEAIKAKVVETQGEEVSEFVAEGRVELGLIVIPNIMSVRGAEAVGPLPAAINSIVMFTAGVSAVSPNQQAARELINLMKSPEAKPIIKAKGNDPV
jgi:ABC-type molybdate transport system substrate-binding protein